ncbi:hypothetical protein WT49_20145 [Burkholderia territorii]|nr:hypothetical protein WT49_20145 [Burkholderia territorii]KWE46957.1 hypothetical protein WT50_08810 [Burkholderia territorii]KWE54313.1 hypothetical protein WT51_03635 [Burkholderia territorii]
MSVAAMIWGSALVAQRASLDVIGPFLFTGLRFLLGAVVVLAFTLILNRSSMSFRREFIARWSATFRAGVLLGAILAVAISLQQIGLRYTKVSNAGFISTLYVIIVPIIGMLFGQRTNPGVWIGAVLAVLGLYCLSVTNQYTIMSGDWYELGGAAVMSAQFILVGHFSHRYDPLMLSLVQFVACGVLCIVVAFVVEPLNVVHIVNAAPSLIYGGILSVGVGFTIQTIAQKDVTPAHAAVIFSMEGVFATLAGWLMLGETLTANSLTGCALMLVGLIVSQLPIE